MTDLLSREEFRQWKELPLTKSVFALLLERRFALLEDIVREDFSDPHLYRIKGIITCIDQIVSGDVIEDEGKCNGE